MHPPQSSPRWLMVSLLWLVGWLDVLCYRTANLYHQFGHEVRLLLHPPLALAWSARAPAHWRSTQSTSQTKGCTRVRLPDPVAPSRQDICRWWYKVRVDDLKPLFIHLYLKAFCTTTYSSLLDENKLYLVSAMEIILPEKSVYPRWPGDFDFICRSAGWNAQYLCA